MQVLNPNLESIYFNLLLNKKMHWMYPLRPVTKFQYIYSKYTYTVYIIWDWVFNNSISFSIFYQLNTLRNYLSIIFSSKDISILSFKDYFIVISINTY